MRSWQGSRRVVLAIGLALVAAPVAACGGATDDASADAGPGVVAATEVVAFSPGEGAGYGQDAMPGVVLGPPKGGGATQGSLDVLSLGVGGSIVLGFGDEAIVDGPGPDFLVFENAFYAGGNPNAVFKELGEVAVSEDGVTFTSFPCAVADFRHSTCAGWHPVYASPENGIPADDPARAGGDPFDLAAIGVARARFVRVTDLSTSGAPPTAGFDLDAIVAVHAERAAP